MHVVQNLGHRLKLEGTVSLKKRNALSAQCEYWCEPSTQFFALYYRLVDPERTIRSNLNDDCFRRNNRDRRARLVGQIRLEPDLLVGDDHENHQQHQQNIDQRDHICFTKHPAFTAYQANTHESPRGQIWPLREDSHNPAAKNGETLLTGLELGGD